MALRTLPRLLGVPTRISLSASHRLEQSSRRARLGQVHRLRGVAGERRGLLQPKTVFIAGRQESGSKRTRRRLRRYRTGASGRISHPKRRYGLDRSRLKGDEGRQMWTEWSILAYNADTLSVRTR